MMLLHKSTPLITKNSYPHTSVSVGHKTQNDITGIVRGGLYYSVYPIG
jgi:hypothetical protein